MALLGVFADSMSYMNVDGMFGVVSLVCNRGACTYVLPKLGCDMGVL